jgi:Chaperone of endosialidase
MAWYNPFSWGEGQKADIDPNAGRLEGADELRRRIRAGLDSVAGRQAPTAQRTMVAPVATGRAAQLADNPQNQFRMRELALANRLTGIATGQQQGAGEIAVQRQGNRALAQQQAFARMGRGADAAGAARAAARNAGEIGLNVAGQAQQAAIGDQAAANAQLGSVLGQGRGADIAIAGQNAQLTQGMNLANLDAQNQRVFQQAGLDQARSLADMQSKLATMGMNDQAQLAYLSQLFGVSATEMQGRLQQEGLKIGNYDPGWGRELMGQIFTTGGNIATGLATKPPAAASDRELKKDTRRVSRQIDQMLDRLKAHSYRYKDEGAHGDGRRAGVMAQDLEGSEAGRRIVREKEDGKYIDVNAGISAALAAVARLNERVREVEKKAK